MYKWNGITLPELPEGYQWVNFVNEPAIDAPGARLLYVFDRVYSGAKVRVYNKYGRTGGGVKNIDFPDYKSALHAMVTYAWMGITAEDL